MQYTTQEWLEEKRLSVPPTAYSDLNVDLRAYLKNHIAFSYEFYTQYYQKPQTQVHSHTSAVQLYHSCVPLNVLVVFIDPSYNAPAGIIAAILPALVNKVENIYIAYLDASDSFSIPMESAVAFEFMGLEDIYGLTKAEAHTLINKLEEKNTAQVRRALIIGPKKWAASLVQEAFKLDLDCKFLDADLKINFDSENDFKQKKDLWQQLLKGATFTKDTQNINFSAAITNKNNRFDMNSLLNATTLFKINSSCPPIWIWPNLALDYFCVHKYFVHSPE